MPRKRKIEGDRYNDPFPQRLRDLMEKNGTSQQVLGDCLKKSRQAVGFYCDGSATPDIDTLLKIANFYDVSADYLLGRTADPSIRPTAADELGLSPASIEGIMEFVDSYSDPFNELNEGIDMLNSILSNTIFYLCLRNFIDTKRDVDYLKKHRTVENSGDNNDTITHDIFDMEKALFELSPEKASQVKILSMKKWVYVSMDICKKNFGSVIDKVTHFEDYILGELYGND